MNPIVVGIFVPLLLSFMFRSRSGKKRGQPVDLGGEEHGLVMRNYRFETLVESHWEGVTTLAELFERSCKEFAEKRLFGTREIIARETVVSSDGRSFEKLHLGGYEWLTYGKAFETVCSFASGLVQIGHGKEERVAIFADTRAEWQIALQGCFRRNVTVVTIYASLGEAALCHSLNELNPSAVVGYISSSWRCSRDAELVIPMASMMVDNSGCSRQRPRCCGHVPNATGAWEALRRSLCEGETCATGL